MANITETLRAHLAAQKAFNTTHSQSLVSIGFSVTELTADIQALSDKITELQNTEGEVTPEDAALITEAETQSAELAAKGEAIAAALRALGEKVPPTVPAVN